jgi:5'-nucleotidase
VPVTLAGQLVVAISSRALFDFEEENRIFEAHDDRAYMQLQLQRLDQPARPGVAFSLVHKLMAFNGEPAGTLVSADRPPAGEPARSERPGGVPVSPLGPAGRPPEGERTPSERPGGVPVSPLGPAGRPPEGERTPSERPGGVRRVEVVILSRNDPVSGMRVFRSARHYGLAIERGVFTRGQSPWRYLRPLAANLFLSTNEADVRSALEAGVPAARVYPHSAPASDAHPNEVRIAFDGDAVLFSDEAERVFQRDGLHAFQTHESTHWATPLAPGPFKPLLEALHRLQRMPASGMRVRTALVTARSAPAHERAIRTLMDWKIEVDEAMFLGGLPKGEFLREFEPDFFFDDQTGHVESAACHVPAGHVLAGVANG